MIKEAMILPNDAYIEQFDIHVKSYLTLGEIKLFSQKMTETDDWCDRELVLDQYLLQFCVREADEFEGMDYEALKHSGVFRAIRQSVTNIQDVYDHVKQATSVNKELGDFLRAIIELATKAEKKMPKQKDLKKAMETFTELKEKANGDNE